MTKEEKSLLFQDLCARLPYGVKCFHPHGVAELESVTLEDYGVDVTFKTSDDNYYQIEQCKPYLRPMSSMTDEEVSKACTITGADSFINGIVDFGEFLCEGSPVPIYSLFVLTDYLNSIHIDYRGLIEKGLALEAPEGIYNN